MNTKSISLLSLVLVSAVSPLAIAAESDFYKLADGYFDASFKHSPTQATATGFHQYDGILEDYSEKEVKAKVALNHDYESRLLKMKGELKGYSPDAQSDYELLLSAVRANLLDLESIKGWQRDPDRYSSGLSSSIFTIMSRTFAPSEERLRSIISREKYAPAVFQAAKANLKNPPKIFTEIALEQIPGIVDFFQTDVPSAFKEVLSQTSNPIVAEFKSTNQTVITELKSYEKWLKEEMLPKSKGDFRIGPENYRKKLLYEEMVDLPVDKILKVGMENLRDNQKKFKETAAKLDPSKTPDQILAAMVKEHPTGAEMLDAFRSKLSGLKQYLIDHKIVTVPSPVLPIIEETPAFERALTSASMDTPGPYETRAKEAYFNVTLPESSWSADRIEEHLQGFSWGTITSTAVHEAYPGHYIQFLWLQNIKSKVRKLLGCGSNAEGWAHYTEQMMLDEGYGGGDLKLRLGQLQDALLRNARLVVGIGMHTGKMTYEEGIDFFVKEGYQSRANAERETKRGTNDPTYLVYTLGKLEIMKLRDDYRKKLGKDFTLQKFHDEFMKQGVPPVKLVRRALMGQDGPML